MLTIKMLCVNKMKCPNCQHNNELSRSRYLKSPFSRFKCDNCALKFKLKRPLSWYGWYISWLATYLLIFVSAFYYIDVNLDVIFLVVTTIMSVFYFEIDRKIESKYETQTR